MVALSSRLTSLPKRHRKKGGLPTQWFKKTATVRGFFDANRVALVDKTCVLSCMSVSGENDHT